MSIYNIVHIPVISDRKHWYPSVTVTLYCFVTIYFQSETLCIPITAGYSIRMMYRVIETKLPKIGQRCLLVTLKERSGYYIRQTLVQSNIYRMRSICTQNLHLSVIEGMSQHHFRGLFQPFVELILCRVLLHFSRLECILYNIMYPFLMNVIIVWCLCILMLKKVSS